TMVDVDIWSTSGIFLRTQKTQLCLAYAYGDGGQKSCENAVTAISRVLYDVPIQKYYALDLDGIAPLNDAIGGVTVKSIYSLPEYNVKYGDEVTLKGNMAEAYVRTRDMDNVNASLNRTDRQVQYINAFANQALPAVVKDFSTITRLYNTASKYSQTNLSLNNATYIGSLLLSKGVTDFETYTLKGKMTASDDALLPDVVHAEFYPDEDNLIETVLNVFYTRVD
ncbi:MAG: LCP family protein, partial [Eubacterium sp.]|nr:LCP family protein [Eubacterium sp.]